MKQKRILEIENYIAEKETVSLIELSDVFKVSLNTIRRDINYLEKNGVLKKVYGGVTSLQGKQLTPYNYRTTKNQEIKDRLSEVAASNILEGDLVFIDSGTTTSNILKYVDDNLKFTILTNNLDIIFQASELENIDLIILGNRYYPQTRSFISTPLTNISFNFNITKAFMGATGISTESGLTISDFNELEIKRVVTEKANQTYILADSSKFDKSSLATYCELEKVTQIITNEPLSEKYQALAAEHSIQIKLA